MSLRTILNGPAYGVYKQRRRISKNYLALAKVLPKRVVINEPRVIRYSGILATRPEHCVVFRALNSTTHRQCVLAESEFQRVYRREGSLHVTVKRFEQVLSKEGKKL